MRNANELTKLLEHWLFPFIKSYFLHSRLKKNQTEQLLAHCGFFSRALRNIFLLPFHSRGLIAPLNPVHCQYCKLTQGEESLSKTTCRGRFTELFPASLLYLDSEFFCLVYHCVGTDHVNAKLHVHMGRRACTHHRLCVQLQRQKHRSERLQKRKS